MWGLLKMLFKSKKERDIAALKPIVDQINAIYVQLHSLTDDELRAKTQEFKKRIADHVAPYKQREEQIEKEIEALLEKRDLKGVEERYQELEKLKKERNQAYEKILNDLLPEAYAVVKETCRRFTENKQLVVTATEWDREIAAKKSNVVIEGDKAIWKNRWLVTGHEIEWDMIHYDVQLMGGIVLHQGKIAEMATGEGKTLVATLPAYLNALTGEGVHIVTVNDYLARRDAEWNGPIFEFHGLSVDCIDLYEPHTPERQKAYQADITYGTNNEFGFDYLRDNMVTDPAHLSQRALHYAIVDEIDSILIDEARTPLIISGPVPHGERDRELYETLRPAVESLVQKQRQEAREWVSEAQKYLQSGEKEKAGELLFRVYRSLPKYKPLMKLLADPTIKQLIQETEAYYLQDQEKNMHLIDEHLYFVIDEKHNQVTLTDKGIAYLTSLERDPNFFVLPDLAVELEKMDADTSLTPEEKVRRKGELIDEFTVKSDRLHAVQQLLKAYTLFERDVDYIVQDNKVLIVDENTGRIMYGRRYSDGLHQALEAKERVKVEAGTQTFATITLQNYFRMYHKLAGMTGTAETEANEFYEIYKLDVVVIPTNKPVIREDKDDLVFLTKREKYNAIIEEIERLIESGRPVLVGTTSVEVSEQLSRMLRLRKIKHEVLNAKHHQREAEIIAKAGEAPYDPKKGKRIGNVTIATNMAGRGTDIKLGEGVKEAGGLAVIGSERHESRRIDLQLRGRAGRQGDPGSSQFFISLEDDLMRLFGSERIAKIMTRLGHKEGEAIQHPMITKQIAKAQKKVEENHFAIRKRLLEYDNVMNQQREVIYRKRRNILLGKRFKVDLDYMIQDTILDIVAPYYESVTLQELKLAFIQHLGFEPTVSEHDFDQYTLEAFANRLYQQAIHYYHEKNNQIVNQVYETVKRVKKELPHVLFIEIHFHAGRQGVRIFVPVQAILETEGKVVIDTLEKQVMLALIDEEWKDFLREMDDLRHSVQTAVYEQKDPLVIYKEEAFRLFMEMLRRLNRKTLDILFKAHLVEQRETTHLRKSDPDEELAKLKASHPEYEPAFAAAPSAQQLYAQSGSEGPNLAQMSRAQRRKFLREQKKKKR